MGGRSGKIILLGDGTEVLTDSDDTEMFDHSEEDKDLDSQVNKNQAPASEDQRSEREGTPAPQSDRQQTSEPTEASSVSNATMEKTRSPQSYLNQSPETGLPAKLANPPKDE